MDRRAKVHGELAADAVLRGVRQDNGSDAVILLKSDRHHHRVPFGSVRDHRKVGDIAGALKLRIGQHTVPYRERSGLQMMLEMS